MVEAIVAGANGYILKTARSEAIVAAVKERPPENR